MADQKNEISYTKLHESLDSSTFSETEYHDFTSWEEAFYAVSVIIYLLDVGTDAGLAFSYCKDGFTNEFVATLFFTVVPAVVVTFISALWYFSDYNSSKKQELSNIEWTILVVMHVLHLMPLIRFFTTVKFGKKTQTDREGKRFYYHTLYSVEASDLSLIRLIHVLLESAPQLFLQFYIVARNSQVIRWDHHTAFMAGVPKDFIPHDFPVHLRDKQKFVNFSKLEGETTAPLQLFTIVSSLLSVAWTLTAYKRTCRQISVGKTKLTLSASVCYFCWHKFTILARVLAMALFASIFSFWIVLGCAIRLICTTTWLFTSTKPLTKTCCLDFMLKSVAGFAYLFTFIKIVDGHTIRKYILFYSYEFIENTIYITLWYRFGDAHVWFYYPALVTFWTSFIGGLLFLYLYYEVFHPTKTVRLRCFTPNSQKKPTKIRGLLSHPNPQHFLEIELGHIPE